MPITKFYLTDKGANLYAKNLAGAALNFTKIQIGKGDVPAGINIVTTTAMYDLVKTLPIAEITKSTKQAQIKFQFTNSDISAAFPWREIGVYATDPDEGEILYVYGNAGAEADTIPPYSTQTIEFLYSVICKVANEATVTATIEKGLLFIAQSEKNVPDGVADYNILKAFMDSKGAEGGLANFDDLLAHITNSENPHGVTAKQVSAPSLTNRTIIPPNADLHDYTTPGSYCCQTNEDAATLVNFPVKTAFNLDVDWANGSSNKMGYMLTEHEYGTKFYNFHGSTWHIWEPLVKDWVATAVTMSDNDYQFSLTVPNFIYTKGCSITFLAPMAPQKINNRYMSVWVGGKWYSLRTLAHQAILNTAWAPNTQVTVTLDQDIQIPLSDDTGHEGTAFISYNLPIYGTWPAKIGNYNQDYTGTETIEKATYYLNNNICHVECVLRVTAVGTGNLSINGLPFAAAYAAVGGVQVMADGAQSAAVKLLLGILSGVRVFPHDATNALFTASMLSVNNRIFFSADYEIA